MKKALALLSCLLILASCVALTGCGKQDLTNSKFLGTWIATKATLANEETPVDEVVDGGMTLKLNPDGTAVMSSKEEDSNCTWFETSKGIKFKGDMKIKMNAEGDALVMKMFGAKIYFEKMSDTAAAVNEIGGNISDAIGGAVDSIVSGAAEIVNDATDGE